MGCRIACARGRSATVLGESGQSLHEVGSPGRPSGSRLTICPFLRQYGSASATNPPNRLGGAICPILSGKSLGAHGGRRPGIDDIGPTPNAAFPHSAAQVSSAALLPHMRPRTEAAAPSRRSHEDRTALIGRRIIGSLLRSSANWRDFDPRPAPRSRGSCVEGLRAQRACLPTTSSLPKRCNARAELVDLYALEGLTAPAGRRRPGADVVVYPSDPPTVRAPAPHGRPRRRSACDGRSDAALCPVTSAMRPWSRRCRLRLTPFFEHRCCAMMSRRAVGGRVG